MNEQEWEDKLAEVQKHSEHWYNKYKELENKIADIKANCDYVLEGKDLEIKELKDRLAEEVELHLHAEEYIKSLEKENAELKKKLKEKLKTIADKDLSFVAKFDALEKENAELEEYKNGNFVQTVNQIIEGKDKRLEQAKEIIKDLLRLPYANDWEVYGDVTSHLDKAEQFLKADVGTKNYEEQDKILKTRLL